MGTRPSFVAAAVMAAAFCFGCGDDGGSTPADAMVIAPDAMEAPDASFNAGACPSSYGPASVAQTFAVPDGTVGFDLDGAADPDGDGTIDNALGEDGDNGGTLRALINGSLSSSLDDGGLRSVSEVRNLADIGADDADIRVVLYGGIDSDDPAFLTDDFDGDEDYYMSREWLDFDTCEPLAFFDGDYTGGVLSGTNDETVFFISALGGFVDFRRARFRAAVEADTKGVKSQAAMPAIFGGVITGCSLNEAPGQISNSALEDVVRLFSVQPDIDLDGDGLETVQAQPGDGIVSCTDGDGTVVPGEQCFCDPRFADGFSISFEMTLVGAGVLGPTP